MKKLLYMACLFILIINLAGCGGGAKRQAISDNPDESIMTTLKLNEVKNGVSLNPAVDKSSGKWVDVKIASDPSSTLFYDVVSLDDYLNDRLKEIRLNVLYFNGNILSSDVVSFMTEMNHEEYGIGAETIGKEFAALTDSSTLYGSLEISKPVSLPQEYGNQDGKEAVLAVAYLPTYCIYAENNQEYTKIFLFVPVYYHFTYRTQNTVDDSNLSDMTHYAIQLTENGTLPSTTE